MTDNDLQGIPRPSQLWKQLSPERKLQAAEAFWGDKNASMEHAEAVVTIAQRIKFRPKSVISLPVEKKAKHLVALGAVSELVAARLLVTYHLAHQRPMMAAFLDALGIAHENGLIQEENVSPATDKIGSAAAEIAGKYPVQDVSLYLNTLFCQDPETWAALADVPQRLEAGE